MKVNEKIIVALDVENAKKALSIVDQIGDEIIHYKVGHQLFTAEGPSIVQALLARDKKVFLDLKLHEISNSAMLAVRSAGRLGVTMVTVHASGGVKMMEAAVMAAKEFPEMKIIALTVVTGLLDGDLKDIGFAYLGEELVLRLANLAHTSGCHGVVASPKAATAIQKKFRKDFLIITPGINIPGNIHQDQQQILTPKEALRTGATHLIIGRAIVDSNKPRIVLEKIIQQVES